jgi:hypothetical protein
VRQAVLTGTVRKGCAGTGVTGGMGVGGRGVGGSGVTPVGGITGTPAILPYRMAFCPQIQQFRPGWFGFCTSHQFESALRPRMKAYCPGSRYWTGGNWVEGPVRQLVVVVTVRKGLTGAGVGGSGTGGGAVTGMTGTAATFPPSWANAPHTQHCPMEAGCWISHQAPVGSRPST